MLIAISAAREKWLKKALKQAKFFDSSEEKIKDIIKLFDSQHEAALFSLLGGTGMEAIGSTTAIIADKKCTSFWNSIRK